MTSRKSFAMLCLVAVWIASGVSLRVAHAQMLCSDYEGNNLCLGFGEPSSSVVGRGVYDSKGPWDTAVGQVTKQVLPPPSSAIPGSYFLQQNVPAWLTTSLGLDKDPETVLVYHGNSGYAWIVAPPEMNPQAASSSALYGGPLPHAPNDQTPPGVAGITAKGTLKGPNSLQPQNAQWEQHKIWFQSQARPPTPKSNGINQHKPTHQNTASHHVHPSMNAHRQLPPRPQANPKPFQLQGSVSYEQPGAVRLPSLASGMRLDTGLSRNGHQQNLAHLGLFGGAQGPEPGRVHQYQQPVYGQIPGDYVVGPFALNPMTQAYHNPAAPSMRQLFTQQSQERPNFPLGGVPGQLVGQTSPNGNLGLSVQGSQRVPLNQGAAPGQENASHSPQNGLAGMQHQQNPPLQQGLLAAKPQQPVSGEQGGAKVEPGHQPDGHLDGLKAREPHTHHLAKQEPVQAQPKVDQSGTSGPNGARMPPLSHDPSKVTNAAQQTQGPAMQQPTTPSLPTQPAAGGSANNLTMQAEALRRVGIIKR